MNYAVEYIPLPEDKFDSVVLSTDKLTVICAKTHPTLKEKISLQQYQSMPHVSVSPRTYSDPGDSSRDLTPVERILGANLPRRNVAMHVGSVLSIPSIVAATDLIATVGLTVAKPWIDRGEVIQISAPFETDEYAMNLYWHKSRSKDPAHVWLTQHFQTYATNI